MTVNPMRGLTYPERLLYMTPEISDAVREVLGALLWEGRDRHPMLTVARAQWRAFRAEYGIASAGSFLTDPESQPKLGKSVVPSFGVMFAPSTGVNVMAQARGMRAVNVCPMASAGCDAACLNTAGHGRFSATQHARQMRLVFAMTQPMAFYLVLAGEIARAVRKRGAIRVRLNVTSDIRWERVAPEFLRASLWRDCVTFYDYTAWTPERRPYPTNGYHLTRSAKETHSVEDIRAMIDAGESVAVPFNVRKGMPLPEFWHGMRVIDGDASDDRTLDPEGVIVGLRAKGEAIGDMSGFVRDAYALTA